MNEIPQEVIIEATRRATWRLIFDWMKDQPIEVRVQAMQKYIQEGGPIPNDMGDEARKLLTP